MVSPVATSIRSTSRVVELDAAIQAPSGDQSSDHAYDPAFVSNRFSLPSGFVSQTARVSFSR